MTINKAQGQSFKQVEIYLNKPVFSHGQLYVALSRARSMEGVIIYSSQNEYMKNIVYKEIL